MRTSQGATFTPLLPRGCMAPSGANTGKLLCTGAERGQGASSRAQRRYWHAFPQLRKQGRHSRAGLPGGWSVRYWQDLPALRCSSAAHPGSSACCSWKSCSTHTGLEPSGVRDASAVVPEHPQQTIRCAAATKLILPGGAPRAEALHHGARLQPLGCLRQRFRAGGGGGNLCGDGGFWSLRRCLFVGWSILPAC